MKKILHIYFIFFLVSGLINAFGQTTGTCTASKEDIKFNTTTTTTGSIYTSGSLSANYSNVGSPAVNMSVAITGNTSDLKSNNPVPTGDGLSVGMISTNPTNQVVVTFTFSQPVSNFTFRLYEVDRSVNGLNYRDSVLIQGYNNVSYVAPSVSGNSGTGYVQNTDWKQTNNGSNLAISGLTSTSGKYVELTFPSISGTGTGTGTYGVNKVVITYTNSPGTVLPSSTTLGQTITIGNFCYDGTTPLPVNLIAFSAKSDFGGVALNWQTASETQNRSFDIERSSNGYSFEKIGEVEGHNNSEVFLNYQFMDTFPFDGYNYYRLKQHDIDGGFAYSKIISAYYEVEGSLATVYPNPIAIEQGILLKCRKVIVENTKLYDMLNHEIGIHFEKQAENLYQLIPQEALSSGIYFLNLRDRENRKISRVIIVP